MASSAGPPVSGFSLLDDDAAELVLGNLCSAELKRIAATCTGLRDIAHRDTLWLEHVRLLLNIEHGRTLSVGTLLLLHGTRYDTSAAAAATRTPTIPMIGAPPRRQACSSYRGMWQEWTSSFGNVSVDQVRATATALSALFGWLAEHHKEILMSLMPPVSEEEITSAETKMNETFCDALKLLYRMGFGGQHLEFDEAARVSGRAQFHPSVFHGLFGSYAFYNTMVSMRLLSLEDVVAMTKQLPRSVEGVCFASSFKKDRVFLVDSQATACVRTLDRRQKSVACCPEGCSLLDWFQEFVDRLLDGTYRCGPILDASQGEVPAPMHHGISLFARPVSSRVSPGISQVTTRNVRTTISALYIPDSSDAGENAFVWAYKVEIAADGNIRSCQLESRHWEIVDGLGKLENVEGPGVIGLFPALPSNDPAYPFWYVSQTSMDTPKGGQMSGSFRFNPGSNDSPDGEPFDAQVGRFELCVPEYIF